MSVSEMEIKGRIHSIETFGAVDGPGIRYVVFLQGCALRCAYCHNPDSWNTDGGEETTSAEVVSDILQYRNFIKSGGVTVSGGEPMLQPEFTADILRRCNALGINTALDTSGYAPEKTAFMLAECTDLLLLDIKAADDELCVKLTGKSNRYAIKLLDYCEKIGREVIIRHVLVPDLTLTEDNLNRLAERLEKYSCVTKTELLPFHKIGEYKWKQLELPYTLAETLPPTSAQTEFAAEILRKKGLNVSVK